MPVIKIRFTQSDRSDESVARVFAGVDLDHLQSTGTLNLTRDEAHVLTGVLLGTVDATVDVVAGDRASNRWDLQIEPLEAGVIPDGALEG